MPVRVSAAESGWVTELLKPLFELFVGEGNVTDHLVRKTAHVAEFAALGFVLLFNWRKGKRFSRTLSGGLLVALLDETIQMFSDRGDLILDVWFDFAGVLIGAVLAWLIFACKKRRAAL